MPTIDKPSTAEQRRSRFITPNIVALAVISLAALNLRPAIASIPPVIEPIRADLALSYTAVSFLTTIPVFCMGLFAFLTPRIARYGRERMLFWAIIVLGGATAARVGGRSTFVLFTTTVVIGVAIAIGQTLLPALVGEYFPDRTAFATGIYSISLALGATIASGMADRRRKTVRSARADGRRNGFDRSVHNSDGTVAFRAAAHTDRPTTSRTDSS